VLLSEIRSCLLFVASIYCPSSQLTLWTCSQTTRGHTCPPSLAVPHRSVTRSPSSPELEAMSRPPSEQVAWLTPQGQQYTSCWPLEISCHTWTLGGDTTVLDDSALATTASDEAACWVIERASALQKSAAAISKDSLLSNVVCICLLFRSFPRLIILFFLYC